MVIACFWRDMGFVASTRFCRESGFVANTRFFGLVLSRLLLRHKGFYSDFVQISAQKIGGWDLWSNLDFSPEGEVDRSVGDVDNVGLVGCKLAFNATWLPQRIFQGPVLT